MTSYGEKLIFQTVSCSICGGTGIIEVFRGDWDEFDQIKCDNCTSLRPNP